MSTSSLVGKWSDPTIRTKPLHKMLVVSINKDLVSRRLWEDIFVAELQKHDLTVTASYRLFPDAVPSTNQIKESVLSSGFDSLLITHRLPVVTNTFKNAGYTTLEPDYVMTGDRYQRNQYFPGYYHRSYDFEQYWPNYYTHYSEVEHDGSLETQRIHGQTISVWTTGERGHIVWSATSRTLEADNGKAFDVVKLRSDIVNLVIPDLVSSKIIRKEK